MGKVAISLTKELIMQAWDTNSQNEHEKPDTRVSHLESECWKGRDGVAWGS